VAYDPKVLAAALATARRVHASPRATKALIEAGLVESGLRNLNYGDADSVGFLQQRPSQGWKGLRDVPAAAAEFLSHAAQVQAGGFHGSAGQLAQAVQRSAYPGRYDQRSGDAKKLLGGGGGSAPAGHPFGGAATSMGAPAPEQPAGLSAGIQAMLQAGQQRPQVQSAGIAAPAFSARPTMAGGSAVPQGGGGPAPAQTPNIPALLAAAGLGQQQAQGARTPGASPASAGASPDTGSPNTGPASSRRFGKSHSPLLELIHNTGSGQGYAVKNGQVVDKSVYAGVWAGHANHVHVAAGKKTIVELGRLAQKMGLTASENSHFGGENPASHVAGSYHNKDMAIDVSGDPRKMNQYAARVEQLYGLGRR
jgi:hypothetical protein